MSLSLPSEAPVPIQIITSRNRDSRLTYLNNTVSTVEGMEGQTKLTTYIISGVCIAHRNVLTSNALNRLLKYIQMRYIESRR